ncbi:hypothetical protein NJBCHELONAE_48820 [Mycobacteroides chelonae]|nr:hypothetical protein NJBCHELONAE_48820 [Mycobacteroides chelonae]
MTLAETDVDIAALVGDMPAKACEFQCLATARSIASSWVGKKCTSCGITPQCVGDIVGPVIAL